MKNLKLPRLQDSSPQLQNHRAAACRRWLIGLATAALLGLPLGLGAAIINIDINGHRTGNPAPPTFVGQGAAGGGTVFNGLAAESEVSGADDDFITVTGTNLLDDNGAATTVGFTISPVAGGNSGSAEGVSTLMAPLLGDWVLVAYYSQSFDASADFVISGLGGAPTADLYFYSRGDWPGGYTIPGATPATFAGSGGFTSRNTFLFKDVPIVNGQITGNFHGIPAQPFLGIFSGLTIKTPPPGPYIRSTSPSGMGVKPTASIKVEIYDNITQLNPSLVQIFLNDQAVTPVNANRPAGTNLWTVTATPSAGFNQDATNTVRIVFGDTSTPPVYQTNEFSFVVVDAAKASKVINVDINGWRPGENPAVTYVGEGAAGGGAVFNPISADSSAGDDNLTIGGTNLLDSIGDPTPVSFTLAPIAGERLSGSADPTSKDNLFGDFASVGLAGQTTGTSDFTISGLGVAPTVDLYLYFREDPGSDGRFAGSTYTIPGAEVFAFTRGIFSSFNTVYLKNVPVVSGMITGIFSGNVGTGGEGSAAGALSGFTIQTPLPRPYVKTALPKGDYVRPNAAVAIELQDYFTAVVTNSIQLFVNGREVTPSITKPAGSTVTTLNYTPSEGLMPEATNTMRIIFSDNATPPLVQTADYSFVVISTLKASKVVNIDINGVGHSAIPLGPTYLGQGAAGGGNVFNGIMADSRLPDSVPPGGPYDDNITIGGTNLLNSLGEATTITFTLGPVSAGNSGAVGPAFSENWAAINHDWILVGYFGQTSGTADFTIGGLGNAPYANLYFYFREDGREGGRFGSGSYTIPGVAEPALYAGRGLFGNHNTTFFKNIPVTNGQITGTFNRVSVLAIMSGLTIELPLPQPYVKSYKPTGLVSPSAAVEIELADYVTQVVSGSVQLFINDQAVTPTVTKPAGSEVTTVRYSAPGGLPEGSTVHVKVVFGDSASPQVVQTQEYTFEVLDETKGAKVINIDINGARGADTDFGPTFVGPGAAGGGTVFNGVEADSRVGDGTDNDFITVTGANLKDSLGNDTTIGFTISPVAGGNSGATGDPTFIACLVHDWVLVAYYTQATDASADFVISGLGSVTNADLYFYSRGDWPGGYTIGNQSPAPFAGRGPFNSSNTIYFDDVPVANGQITGNFHGIPNAPYLGILSGLTIDLSLPVVGPPGPLSIQLQGLQVVLSWTGSGTLQSADSLTGQWTDMIGATSPQSVSPTAAQKFYRLRR